MIKTKCMLRLLICESLKSQTQQKLSQLQILFSTSLPRFSVLMINVQLSSKNKFLSLFIVRNRQQSWKFKS